MQMMRDIETQVRREKDTAIAAQAAGDDALRQECQRNINALVKRYSEISKASGNAEKRERMTVEGFRAVKAPKDSEKVLTSGVGSGTMELNGVVEDKKITGFFLNPESKHGNEFLSVGYSTDKPDVLKNDLLEALRTCKRIPEKTTEHGERFSMDAMLGITEKRNFQLIWQIDKSTGIPRIITGHRRKEGRK